MAGAHRSYGSFSRNRRRYAEAEPLVSRAYEMRTEKLGKAHPYTVRAGQELATLYRETGLEQKATAIEQAVK